MREDWKQRVVEAGADDAVYSADLFGNGWEDAPHRMLRNRIVAEWEASPTAPRSAGTIGRTTAITGEQVEVERYRPFMSTPRFDGDLEEAPLWAGQSAELVHDIAPAGKLVARIVGDAERALYSVTTYSNDAQQTSAKRAS